MKTTLAASLALRLSALAEDPKAKDSDPKPNGERDGAAAVENKVHIHDLHATILDLLGLDHEKLTYRYAGRDFRLTDVHENVVKGIMASVPSFRSSARAYLLAGSRLHTG